MYISKEQAIEIIQANASILDQPTGPIGAPEVEWLFTATFGEQPHYLLEDVLRWLGY